MKNYKAPLQGKSSTISDLFKQLPVNKQTILTEDEFEAKFTIVENPHEDRFETYGKEFEDFLEIYKSNPKTVWAMIDEEDGSLAYVSGYDRFRENIYYIATEESVEDGVEYKVILDTE